MTENGPQERAFSAILHCKDRARTQNLIQAMLLWNKEHHSSGEILVVLEEGHLPYFKDNTELQLIVVEEVGGVAKAKNQCAQIASGKVLVFISDRVLPEDLPQGLQLVENMPFSGWDAVSPCLWATKEKQFAYRGEPFSEAIFYGYPKYGYLLDHPQEYPTDAGQVDFWKTVDQADTLADDFYMVQAEAFAKTGGLGLDERDGLDKFYTLALSCRMAELGCKVGCIKGLTLQLHKLPFTGGAHFGTEVFSLLGQYGSYFVRTSPHMYRGVLSPPGWRLKKESKGRVMLLSHELSRSGAPVVLFDMAAELDKLGYDVFFMSLEDGLLADQIVQRGIPIVFDSESYIGRGGEEIDLDLSVPLLMDGMVGAFDWTLMSTLLTHHVLTRYNGLEYPIYWWLHEGPFYWEEMHSRLPKLGSNIQVLAGGYYVQQAMQKYNFLYDSKVLVYGVEDQYEKFAGEKLANTYDGENRPVKFMLPGAIQVRKGHDILIQAILSLPLQYMKRVEIHFVGRPVDKGVSDEVEMFCASWPNAYWVDVMPREDLYKMYQEMDAVVCPSRDDPLPVVLTENMMFYGVCIASDTTGTSYYLEDGVNGFVFKNEDCKDLARCIMQVVDRCDNLEEIRQNSRELFEKTFDMPVFDQQLLELFDKEKL